jgi:hypothetical protein
MNRFDTCRDSFPNSRLGRSPTGVLEMALHSDGNTGARCRVRRPVPALTNAIFPVTDKRLRKLPIDAAVLNRPA